MNEDVEDYTDLIAERVVQLGGVAEGTARIAAKRSNLSEYSIAITAGHDHAATYLRKELTTAGGGALGHKSALGQKDVAIRQAGPTSKV